MQNPTPLIFVVPDCHVFNGKLDQGFWLKACEPASEVRKNVRSLIRLYCEDGCQHWSIQSTRNFCGIQIPCWMPLEEVCELGEMLMIHGAAYAIHLKHFGPEHTSPAIFSDRYQGCWDSKEDYFAHMVSEIRGKCDELPLCNLTNITSDQWTKLLQILFDSSYVGYPSSPTAYHVFRWA